MGEVREFKRSERRRWTREEIEATLREQLPYWLPHGGEAGDTPEQRARVADYAATTIASRLPGAATEGNQQT